MKIISIISNYDKDIECLRMFTQLSKHTDTYIVDSSSKVKFALRDKFVQTDTPFGGGCFNKAMEVFLNSDADYAMCVCSDVVADWDKVFDRINSLDLKNIGDWTPSILGQSWKFLKSKGYGLREVPFCEGMIHLLKREVAESIYPLDVIVNPHAYANDIFGSYIAKRLGYKVICDDSISVFHPHGKGYSKRKAENDMLKYIRTKSKEFQDYCKKLGIGINPIQRLIRRLIGLGKNQYK